MQLQRFETTVSKAIRRVRPAPLAALLKHLLRIERRVHHTAHGTFWIDPVSNFGGAILASGEYERPMIDTLMRLLTKDGVFVDLGANEGYFSILAGIRVGPTGSVIAIEPQERLAPVIRENVRLNDLKNVKLVQSAISDKEGEATLYLLPDLNTGGSSFTKRTRYAVPTQTTHTMTLEQLFDTHGLGHVDLLKVDIEGAEYEALMGSPAVFANRRVKALALELHPAILAQRGKDSADIESFLAGHGYCRSPQFSTDVWLPH